MGAWAETTVKRRGDLGSSPSYPPCEGEKCAECEGPFRQGERAFRLTERSDDAWVCEDCTRSVDCEGMGV